MKTNNLNISLNNEKLSNEITEEESWLIDTNDVRWEKLLDIANEDADIIFDELMYGEYTDNMIIRSGLMFGLYMNFVQELAFCGWSKKELIKTLDDIEFEHDSTKYFPDSGIVH